MAQHYEYRRADGKLAFVKVRFAGKKFAYRRPDGKPAQRLPKLLYRLPELIASDPSEFVFIAEGEKDVDRLISCGLTATCNYDGGGRGKWQAQYNRYFRGRHVVILPDNDTTGQVHAADVAKHLHAVACSVKLLDLDGLPPKGDVSDWLDGGGSVTGLLELAEVTSVYRPKIELARPVDPWNRKLDSFQANEQLRFDVEQILRLALRPQEKLLLIVVSVGLVHPTQRNIALAAGLSPERTKKIIAELRRRNIVKVTKRGRQNQYWLVRR